MQIPAAVPEPATIALAGIGLITIGVASCRRLRRSVMTGRTERNKAVGERLPSSKLFTSPASLRRSDCAPAAMSRRRINDQRRMGEWTMSLKNLLHFHFRSLNNSAAFLVCSAAVATALAAAPGPACGAPSYVLTEIISPANEGIFAMGVNALGQAAGSYYLTDHEANVTHGRAFWYNGTSVVDIGTLGGPNSVAYAINDRGVVVGGSDFSFQQPSQAFRWSGGTMEPLGSLGGSFGVAYAVNNNGWIVGVAADANDQNRPFLFSDGQMIDLGVPEGFDSGVALAINDRGQIVGAAFGPGPTQHAVLWDDGGIEDLGTFGGAMAVAYGLNNARAIVGAVFDQPFPPGLAALAEGGEITRFAAEVANDINDKGQIVGYGLGPKEEAYLISDRQLIALQDLAVNADDWTSFNNATAISEAGHISGYGYKVGLPADAAHTASFILTPVPEPAGTMLAAAAIATFILGLFIKRNRSTQRGPADGSAAEAGSTPTAPAGSVRSHVLMHVPATAVPYCFLLTVLLLTSAASHVLAASGDVYNLGTLGGTTSTGFGVNAAGQVTGISVTADGELHAFLYSGPPGSGGAMADLGTLGGVTSKGWGINANGQVAGESYFSRSSSNTHAFLYTGTPGSGGAMVDLGSLVGGASVAAPSFAGGINANGQVAGTSVVAGSSATHAFRYTGTPGSGGAMTDLGTLGGLESIGIDINTGGQVTGYSETGGNNNTYHAFLYTGTPGSGGAMADLGTLAGAGDSYGGAINDSGQVTGYSGEHAFLYTGTPGSGGAMADLGTLGRGSRGWGINANGQVAGESDTIDFARHAFLYTGRPGADGHMIDLDAWLDANNPTEGAKWTLLAAQGLTDTGLITGVGDYNDGPGGLTDGTRAFLLEASTLVPEPATGILFIIALLGLAAASLRYVRRSVITLEN